MDMKHTVAQPQELARAESFWANFVRVSRIVCAIVITTLVLMAIFLL